MAYIDKYPNCVLILVVMEDGLRLLRNVSGNVCPLLILVVMEDGLRPLGSYNKSIRFQALNPCCNGRWSLTPSMSASSRSGTRLNPCCNGRWSQTINLLVAVEISPS